jgi:spore coat protein U-like protein
MFKKSVLKLYVAAALLGVSGFALAGGATNLTVNAKILGVCKVTTPPGTLDFGIIDPSDSADHLASITFVMKCTNGTTSTAATENNGSNFSGTKRMLHTNGTAYLAYAISGYANDTGLAGTGFGGATRTVTINGTITQAQYQNALATTGSDMYTDTVIITVNP